MPKDEQVRLEKLLETLVWEYVESPDRTNSRLWDAFQSGLKWYNISESLGVVDGSSHVNNLEIDTKISSLEAHIPKLLGGLATLEQLKKVLEGSGNDIGRCRQVITQSVLAQIKWQVSELTRVNEDVVSLIKIKHGVKPKLLGF